jgi:hypothetical protein
VEKLLELLDVFDREDKANMYLRGRRPGLIPASGRDHR